MADFVHFELAGQTRVIENFNKVVTNVRDKMMKKATRAAAEPIRDAAKALVHRRTGALQDSIDIKITSSGSKGEVVRAWIGPRRGIRVPARLVETGTHAGHIFVAIPTRYAHLIEFGHRIVVHGHEVGFAAPIPFMRPAWAIAGGDVALENFTASLERDMAALTI